MNICNISDCKICNIKNNTNINKTLLLKVNLCIDICDNLLLIELKNLILNFMYELYLVRFSDKDFLDKYVGWTYYKTIDLLQNNREKIIIINNSHSLIHHSFGKEAIDTIKIFINENKDIIIIFN